MKTRLFHTIVVCGAALASSAGCGSLKDAARPPERAAAGTLVARHEERCRLPDGTCHHQCRTLASGACLDPCFVHTDTCNPVCVLPDGTCGWPPTK